MGTDQTIEQRLLAVEDRLRRLEDEQAIRALIASYGPLVDAADADAVAALWTEDGSYDVEGWQMNSRADVRAMVDSTQHGGLVAAGCCHFLGPVVIDLDGDRALAVCEALLVLHSDGRFRIARAGVSRFELTRSTQGWQIARRTARTLDGSAEARALLELAR